MKSEPNGHIVIDEVQDLTPMQLKMATRRSLNGAMTIVGDLAQATGPLAPNEWDDVLRYLPDRKPARVIGLSVGYRIPGQIMELANRVMAVATPVAAGPLIRYDLVTCRRALSEPHLPSCWPRPWRPKCKPWPTRYRVPASASLRPMG